jgi:uncharacterized protein DUF3352
MQQLRVVLCVVLTVVFAGCGDDAPEATGPATLKYVPADADAVAIVPTDFDGEQLRRLSKLLEPTLRDEDVGSLRDVAADFFGEGSDVDFARDVEPLLGKELVAATWGDPEEPELLVALETSDPERAKALVRTLELTPKEARVDGNTLLFSVNGGDTLDQAMGKHDAFDPAAFDTGDDALVRVAGDARALVRELGVDVDLPWIQALETAAASIKLEDHAITAHARVVTRPDDLSDDDLPLVSGDDAPQAGDVDGALSSGNRNQSQTTVFLAQLARKAYPDSEFVAQVESVESDLGISFEDEVLRQFNGPSASVAWPDGNFAAVSDLDDPDRMRELLPKLAPRLPDVLSGLQSLGNRGLLALLLVAPDAPLVPGALPLLQSGDIGVRRLSGTDLYELTGLDEGDVQFQVPQVVFGMIDDRFVVASSLDRARQVAEMDVSDVDDASGGAVARADFSTWDSDPLGIETVPLGEGVGELEASTEGLEGSLTIDVPGGLD